MQCIIICAGKGTRMRPLTDTIPKPLIPVCGKPILEHIVEALPAEIDELILVTHYLEDQIKAYCGEVFCGRPVTYIHQENPSGGTGDALMCTKNVLKGKFLFMYADDIHGADALARVCAEDHAILAMKTDDVESFGILDLQENGTLRGMVEKPKAEDAPSNWANISGWVVTSAIFNYAVALSPRGELEATDMITAYAADHPVTVIEQDLWLPIGYPEHIQAAESVLCPDK